MITLWVTKTSDEFKLLKLSPFELAISSKREHLWSEKLRNYERMVRAGCVCMKPNIMILVLSFMIFAVVAIGLIIFITFISK